MIDEQEEPSAQSLQGRVRLRKNFSFLAEFRDLVSIDFADKFVAAGKVPIERSDANARRSRDLLQARIRALSCKGLASGIQQLEPVAFSVNARFPGG